MSLRLVVSSNVKTLMPTRGYERNKDLAESLGWTESKMTRTLKDGRWELNDLPAVARALNVSTFDLLREPSEYLPGAATAASNQEYPLLTDGCVVSLSQARDSRQAAAAVAQVGATAGVKIPSAA